MRYVFYDSIEQIWNTYSWSDFLILIVDSPAHFCSCIYNWVIKLLIICLKFAKQVKYFVFYFLNSAGWSVNFVYHYNWFYATLECLLQHKLGLWHWTLSRADNQTHSIDHSHDTFNFTAKVLMAWCVNEVYSMISMYHTCTLWENSYTTFLFKGVAVHCAFSVKTDPSLFE